MELLIVIFALGLLVFLAMRFGYDSRAVPYSKEHELARHGMVWDVHLSRLDDLRREAVYWRVVRQAARPRRRVRSRVAFALREFAYRLSPELATQPAE
jgi:hypothetical protein